MSTVRELSFETLEAVLKDGAYSNLKMNEVLQEHELSPADRGLYTALVYGTLKRKLTLDFYLKPFIKTRVKGWVRRLLWMSLYQFVYMDKIPTHAIINEAVEIAKQRGGKQTGNTVNAILRQATTQPLRNIDSVKNKDERLSVRYSLPTWIIRHWKTHFGLETTEAIAEQMLLPAVQTVRVNRTKISVASVVQQLEEEGYHVQQDRDITHCLIVEGTGVMQSQLFKQGKISIQDKSSMFVAEMMNLQPGHNVLDCCSAPGGKSCHMAEILDGSGHILATDIHDHKIGLIQHNINKLGLSGIEAHQHDATVPYEGEFDRILVDAPCSGLGVLRHKPEIRYTMTQETVDELVKIQLQILNNVAQNLKIGGELIYSTCTIEQMENENVIYTFLKAHPEFEFVTIKDPRTDQQVKTLQLLPQDYDADGFFITKIRRKDQ
ncbi:MULTISPECIES: 16S rRNA (cytosine(967)-C(5))-methyltransferase RsmB [unclassified Staphylococcus]|uniref:16S rRNA (cytosine(967)-C(5))-methyltransferase RsmB n=1 Tax=unclassified Staphylococcus TaxID=91994 RepID=UPI0021D02035|nr:MULTISPECIES: 16S rRNA (cytosine(967)-C(5))-methyltransferase RsmB [unclassified Staphylococcus]UXR70350.1 16S rRNA (cytosine(967)-C(5))-methyltransferase RsmB [Staphylococcus sp. IVB6246]UXR72416.1 16S rRNA (cytosine(967)-C(5))-methyltransferase RsmB [Staphylococcus sp. IVB6240]UXR74720.1 16S rRNA (cytosine(967)-C(5))-methyltransferase RsmB [Staphylococcus sp. IVB6238]UXR77053.1 16S rRNA (cytosine(967)-C(5))-methyltransferase RsmB [Staphylococcus sp. IVB6233]UXR81178.1 16S rRNA (cytosine(9